MGALYIFFISAVVWSSYLPEIFAGSHYYNPYGMRNKSSLNIEVISIRTELGESPFWDDKENQLYYVDQFRLTVNRYDPYRKTTTTVYLGKLDQTGQTVNTYDPYRKTTTAANSDNVVAFVIPLKGERNKFVIGYGTKIAVLTWDGVSPRPDNLEIVTNAANSNDGTLLNDAKADALGRLWSGTVGPRIGSILEYVPNAGILFRLTKAKTVDIQARGITISNGIAWSLNNKKMYYADTTPGVIYIFDYDLHQGTISNPKVLFDYTDNRKQGVRGFPDGLTVDAEDKLWVANFAGAQVLRIDPETGKLLRSISFPAYQTTSVAFGGPNYEELFVTSANAEIPADILEKYPLSGYTFRLTGLGVRGVPPRRVVL